MLRHIIILLFILISGNVWASGTPQAKLDLIVGGYDSNGKITAGVRFNIASGWHIYWKTPGDTGFATQITKDNSENISSFNVKWPLAERKVIKFDEYISESYVYENEIVIPLDLLAIDFNKSANIGITVDYAVCNDICIAGSENLSAVINPGTKYPSNINKIEEYRSQVPLLTSLNESLIKEVNYDNDILDISLSGKHYESSLLVEAGNDFNFIFKEIFFNEEKNISHYQFDVTSLDNNKSLKQQNLVISYNIDGKVEEVEVDNELIKAVVAQKPIEADSYYSTLLWIMLLGFIGGMILNIMPCVLPVLSIKLIGVIKYSQLKASEIRVNFLVTALGVIASFLLLALVVIFLKSAGHNVGWGFHFQEPYFIIFLILVLSIFSANMLGVFNINLPISFGRNKSDNSSTLWSNFLTGFMATLLATPCTAPFLGTAVSFALTHGNYEIIAVFCAMGVGLAFPYILVAINPNLTKILPKPGAWINRVKYILGSFLAITAFWLLWVFSSQMGIIATLVLFVIISLKWLKLIKFRNSRSTIKIMIIIIAAAMAFTLPIKSKNLEQSEVEKEWIVFSESLLEENIKKGNIVLVDITADWCLTCQANKFLVLNTKSAEELFAKYNVVLMRGDWTNKDEDIYRYLQSRGVYGIPFNAVYGPAKPSGVNLPILLSKGSIEDAIIAVKLD